MIQIFKNLKSKVLTLGIVLAGIMCAGIFMQSCSQDNDFSDITINEDEKSLNLTAPNGEKIADNIFGLKEIVSVSIAEKFGIDKEFSVTSLEYTPVSDGYVVLIKYKTSDNMMGGIVRTNSHSVFIETGMEVVMYNNIRLKSGGENNTVIYDGKTITCFSVPDNANCTCIPVITPLGDGKISITCYKSPSTCTCQVRIPLQ
jgi:hypothetical protein